MKNIANQVYGKSFHAFVQKAYRFSEGKELSQPQLYLEVMIWYLESFLRGDIKKLLVNLPGRHLKTFLCSICFPAFALGLDPSLKIMIVAYNEETAEGIVLKIREIMNSSWYKAAFNTRISRAHSRKNDFFVKGGGRVRAAAVRSLTGKGGDIIIFDDPHNAADWDNDRKKQKVIEAFEMLVTRRDGGRMSRMLVVGHRIAEDDVSAHILERGDFEHVCLPLFAPEPITFKLGPRTWTLGMGEALRPDAYPLDDISSIRENHRGPPFWLYFQQGLGGASDDFEINVSHFPFVPSGPLGRQIPKGVPVVLSVDPAQQTNSSSRNVIHVYAIRGAHYELVWSFAEKCSFHRLAKKVEQYATRYGAWFVIIEKTARGSDLIDEMKLKLSAAVIPVVPKGSKADRLRKCAPIIRDKRVRIRRFAPVEEAIDEIVAYPYGPYDDHVDAMTNFLLQLPDIVPPPPRTSVNSAPPVGITRGTLTTRVLRQGNDVGYARGRSIFGPQPLPDFSDGRGDDAVYVLVDGKKVRIN